MSEPRSLTLEDIDRCLEIVEQHARPLRFIHPADLLRLETLADVLDRETFLAEAKRLRIYSSEFVPPGGVWEVAVPPVPQAESFVWEDHDKAYRVPTHWYFPLRIVKPPIERLRWPMPRGLEARVIGWLNKLIGYADAWEWWCQRVDRKARLWV